MFIDKDNKLMPQFESVLEQVQRVEGGRIRKVPAGYSLEVGNGSASLQCTRYAFTIAMHGKAVIELPIPKAVKWNVLDTMRTLNPYQLIAVQDKCDYLRYQTTQQKVCRVVDSVGNKFIVGQILQVLEILGMAKLCGSSLEGVSIIKPTKEMYIEYGKQIHVKDSNDYNVFIVDRREMSARFPSKTDNRQIDGDYCILYDYLETGSVSVPVTTNAWMFVCTHDFDTREIDGAIKIS